MNKIIIEIKNVYGNEMIYPVCEQAKNFAALAGTKTLTHHAMAIIQKMGFTIEVKQVSYGYDN